MDDVHAAVYQHLIECIGCPPGCLEDYGLVLSRTDDGAMHSHYQVHETVLVVRDGKVFNEFHTIIMGKRTIQIFNSIDLCDPNSLDFQNIRVLAGM